MSSEYLYHYTNVESLALILKNKTIRLNSLDKMDDLQEKEVGDLKNFGQFFYVSSWMDDKTESIPMWKMYTDMKSGIRIKLKKNPFKKIENKVSDLEKVFTQPIIDKSNGNNLKSLIPLAIMVKDKYISMDAFSGNVLHQVTYTNDENLLYPKVLDVNEKENKTAIEFAKVGKYKNEFWSFQKEWRYILHAIPFNFNLSPTQILQQFNLTTRNIIMGIEKQPVQYLDLVIDDEALIDMEITLSPKISIANELIVNDLVEKYNPHAQIVKSKLTGLI